MITDRWKGSVFNNEDEVFKLNVKADLPRYNPMHTVFKNWQFSISNKTRTDNKIMNGYLHMYYAE